MFTRDSGYMQLAPGVALAASGGQLLANLSAASLDECAETCWEDRRCAWLDHCDPQVGARGALGRWLVNPGAPAGLRARHCTGWLPPRRACSTRFRRPSTHLAPPATCSQEGCAEQRPACLLYSSGCRLEPEVEARDQQGRTAGGQAAGSHRGWASSGVALRVGKQQLRLHRWCGTLLCRQLSRRCNCTYTHAGVPARSAADAGKPPAGFSAAAGTGVRNRDLAPCSNSTLPGRCAFGSLEEGLAACRRLTACAAVAFYANGTDGCSAGPAAVLLNSTSAAAPPDGFVSPEGTVYDRRPSKEVRCCRQRRCCCCCCRRRCCCCCCCC